MGTDKSALLNIRIEKADKRDAEAILAIQRMAFQSEAELYNDFRISPLTQTADELRKDFDTHTFLKAVVGRDKIIGSVKRSIHDNVCWIKRLIVSPEHQNQGVGKRLMAEIEKRFPDAAQYKLGTGSRSIKNIQLYQKLGYRIAGEKKESQVTLVLMEKENGLE
jgi:ribosomal protein S18 acetylase RimI-like enzyme